ncbi:MAG: hypothetical protein DME75_12525 [Verrucomicrobia bacterium]|nr:MAG: hypothetical protein DME75_12525 [Verrucomicrobiota bacterium]PYL17640.1 MAG: hypothetical protein DMF41_13570 [Verrucomicrobiota bacterium]
MARQWCRHGVFLFLAFTLGSCASVPEASHRDRALASNPPTTGKAKIFVYRPGRLLAAGVTHRVFIDGRLLGTNASGTFLAGEIDPGRHALTAGTDQHELNALAGETYYYEQYVWFGMADPSNATALKQVSASEGRKGVAGCKQAATSF